MEHRNHALDPTPYQRAPRLTVEGTLALALALLAVVPRPIPELLARFVARLREVVRATEGALTVRRRELAPTDPSDEVVLDNVADGLWATLRSRLQSWSVFEPDGPVRVLESATLQEAGARAEQARALHGRLFGAEGLAFTQRPYPEQALHMASILRLIDEDDLAPAIDALVGPEVLAGLRLCQVHYEAMVRARIGRDASYSDDLGSLRRSLQQAIARYTNAVMLLADEGDPGSLEVVRDALRPMDEARAQLARTRSRGAGAEEEAPVEEDEAPSEALEEAAAQ